MRVYNYQLYLQFLGDNAFYVDRRRLPRINVLSVFGKPREIRSKLDENSVALYAPDYPFYRLLFAQISS